MSTFICMLLPEVGFDSRALKTPTDPQIIPAARERPSRRPGIATVERCPWRHEDFCSEPTSAPSDERGLRVTLQVAVSMRRRREADDGGREIAELAALADGSLDAGTPCGSSRRAWPDRQSLPTVSPSSSGRWRSHGQPLPRSRHRLPCARGSRRSGARVAVHEPVACFVVDRRRRGGGSGRGGRVQRARLGQSGRALQGGPRLRPRWSRAPRGEATLDEDVLRLADHARRDGPSPPRQRPVLRGVAPQPSWRARPDRDVQRGTEGHALGRRLTEGLPHAVRHARTRGRRSGLLGRQGARRHGRHHRLKLTPRSGARPAGARGRGGS